MITIAAGQWSRLSGCHYAQGQEATSGDLLRGNQPGLSRLVLGQSFVDCCQDDLARHRGLAGVIFATSPQLCTNDILEHDPNARPQRPANAQYFFSEG